MTTIRTLSNQGEAAFLLSVLQGNGFDAVLLDEGAFQYSAVMTSMRLQVFLQKVPQLRPDFTYREGESSDGERIG